MNRTVGIGALVLVTAVGVAGAALLRSDRGAEVRVTEVDAREIVSTVTATGQVRARRQVNISSDVMGRVAELFVEEGDEVEAGQVLLRVDPSQIRAAVSSARAALSQAEAQIAQQRANLFQAEREFGRLSNLRAGDPGLISTQSLEEAETRVDVQRALLESAVHGAEQARAGVEDAEDQLSRTTIRSPITGRIIRMNIEEGETAVVGTMNQPGSLLLTIGDLSTSEVVLTVAEIDIPRISLGDSAVIELDAFPRRTFLGQVARISTSAIRTEGGAALQPRGNVDFEVVLALLDPPEGLRPDLSATADIIVERRGALAVPIISVTVREDDRNEGTLAVGEGDKAIDRPILPRRSPPNREGVFVVRDGRAAWTPVTLGITGQEYFEILDGVAAGDAVISGPYQTIRDLQDGDAVRVIEESARGGP